MTKYSVGLSIVFDGALECLCDILIVPNVNLVMTISISASLGLLIGVVISGFSSKKPEKKSNQF